MKKEEIYCKIGKDLVEAISGKPYGSIPKKELDLLLFSILYRNGYYNGKSNYEISLELKISEARLYNLIYEMKLRFPLNEKTFEQELANIVMNFSFNKQKGTFNILVQDLYIRNAIINKLEEKGIVYDFTFNKKLLVLDTNQYAELLDLLLPEQEKKSILKEAKKQGYEDSNFRGFATEILKAVVSGAVEGGTSAIIGQTNTMLNIVNLVSKGLNLFNKKGG